MGRREKPINRTGPVATHAEQLRLLREAAGLTLDKLAKQTGLAKSTLSKAQGGVDFPSWEVTKRFVGACGGDVAEWKERWDGIEKTLALPKPFGTPAPLKSVPVFRRGKLATYGAIRDLSGPPPLPLGASTAADFVMMLRQVKVWAGDPSIRYLASRARVPRSTLHDALKLNRGKLPNLEAVCAFLTACGIDDTRVISEWVFTWRRLRTAEQAGGPGKGHLKLVK
jgi:DNA-binding XRE family transcriptional regulator